MYDVLTDEDTDESVSRDVTNDAARFTLRNREKQWLTPETLDITEQKSRIGSLAVLPAGVSNARKAFSVAN